MDAHSEVIFCRGPSIVNLLDSLSQPTQASTK